MALAPEAQGRKDRNGDQHHRPQVDQRNDQPLHESNEGVPAAAERIGNALGEGHAGRGQGDDLLQIDVYGRVADLLVHVVQLAGVVLQFVLHIGKLALDFQQIRRCLCLIGQFVQAGALGLQRGKSGLYINVAACDVLGVLADIAHAACLANGGQKRAVVVHRHPHGVVGAAVVILFSAVNAGRLHPCLVGLDRCHQGLAGSVKVGGFHRQAGVVDDFLRGLIGGSLGGVGGHQAAVRPACGAVVIVAFLRGGLGGVVTAFVAAGAAAARQQCGGGQRSGDTGDAFFHGWMLLSFVKASPQGGSCQWPRPLTDEGGPCDTKPFAGNSGKLAPHLASDGASATFPQGGRHFVFPFSPI